MAGKPLEVTVNGDRLAILPEEVEVRAQAKAGFSVASEGAYLAALVTELTPELVREGLAREFVRRVQDLRKQLDLDIADRIRVYYNATPGLKAAVADFQGYIMGETLAVELKPGSAPAGVPTTSDEFDKEKLTIGLEKTQKK